MIAYSTVNELNILFVNVSNLIEKVKFNEQSFFITKSKIRLLRDSEFNI